MKAICVLFLASLCAAGCDNDQKRLGRLKEYVNGTVMPKMASRNDEFAKGSEYASREIVACKAIKTDSPILPVLYHVEIAEKDKACTGPVWVMDFVPAGSSWELVKVTNKRFGDECTCHFAKMLK